MTAYIVVYSSKIASIHDVCPSLLSCACVLYPYVYYAQPVAARMHLTYLSLHMHVPHAIQVYCDFADRVPNAYGIFTRDFRTKALECRVLVTVPQCLEILLLSSANREWVSRIRSVLLSLSFYCILSSACS